MSEKRFIIVKSIYDYYALVDKERKDTKQILILSLHKEQLGAVCDLLNEQDEEIKELQLQLEAFKDKLCELGVSDVKLYGKRYYTGLEEWLE